MPNKSNSVSHNYLLLMQPFVLRARQLMKLRVINIVLYCTLVELRFYSQCMSRALPKTPRKQPQLLLQKNSSTYIQI
jgi:hypothetical protein